MSSTIQRITARLHQVQAMDTSYSVSPKDIEKDIAWVSTLAGEATRNKTAKIIKTAQKNVQLVAFTSAKSKNSSYVAVRQDGDLVGFVKFAQEEFGRPRTRSPKLLTPHATFSEAAQGKGYASSIYTWALSQGLCFLSSGTQSKAANVLWSKLGRTHPWFLVAKKLNQPLAFMGDGAGIPRHTLNSYDTRLVMLGKGWSVEKFRKTFGVIDYTPPADVGDSDDDEWDEEDDNEDYMPVMTRRRAQPPGYRPAFRSQVAPPRRYGGGGRGGRHY